MATTRDGRNKNARLLYPEDVRNNIRDRLLNKIRMTEGLAEEVSKQIPISAPTLRSILYTPECVSAKTWSKVDRYLMKLEKSPTICVKI